MEIIGYTQPVVAAGHQRVVEVKVSTTSPRFDVRIDRLAPKPDKGVGALNMQNVGLLGRVQAYQSGSWMLVQFPRSLPVPERPVTVGDEPIVPGRGSGDAEGNDASGDSEATLQMWMRPTHVEGGAQCVASFTDGSGACEIWLEEGGRLRWKRISRTGEEFGATATVAVAGEAWSFVAATWSGEGASLELYVQAEHSAEWTVASSPSVPITSVTAPFRPDRMALAASIAPIQGGPVGHFNGRIDSPCLWSRRLDATEIQALALGAPARRVPGLACEWQLVRATRGLHPTVPDDGPLQAHGELFNLPTVHVAGAHWDGLALSPAESPEQYNAAHFHDDDLSDCEWDTDCAIEIPPDWPSGVYAVSLRANESTDEVPFIVSASGRVEPGSGHAVAVLLPTFSYLAYANEHASWQNPIPSSDQIEVEITAVDRYVADHRLLSVYDRHSDGTGSCYSSWRRPVLNFRDGYHLPLVRGPHQFSADLELLRFLDSQEIAYDVVTDDDLHRLGAGALLGYRLIVTGSHPEYWSWRMLRGLDEYLASAGRLAYLGGNGFYWVTGALPAVGEVIEVRRGLSGTRVWESEPGEEHHFFTGERGGLWRNRGWAPQRLVGVGFTAQGFDRALPFEWLIDESHPIAGFICRGIDTSSPLDAPGSVLGGAAGFEIDRLDRALGTPKGTVLVASAEGFSDAYQGTTEDILAADSRQGGTISPLVRADMTFSALPSGGAVFSVGSISWCGALAGAVGNNTVARVTTNVIDRMSSPEPFT